MVKTFMVAALTLLTVGGSAAIDCPAHPRISDSHDPEMLRRCNSYWESITPAGRVERDNRGSGPYQFPPGYGYVYKCEDGREGRQTIFNHAAYCADVRGNYARLVMWDRSLTAAQKRELIAYDVHHCRCVQVKIDS